MKRQLLFLFLVALSSLSYPAWYGYQNNGISYELVSGDLLYVSGQFNGTPWVYKGVYSIPASYKPAGKAFEIYGIKQYAFSGSPDIIKLTANSISRIEPYAFLGCSRLKEVSINKVERIENGAFAYCANLGHIELPSTLTYIGEKAFEGCEGLRYISIPSSVKETGSDIFKDCSNLKIVKIFKNSESVYQSICSMLDPDKIIVCSDGYSEKAKIEKYWSGKVISYINSIYGAKSYSDACYFEIPYEVHNETDRMYIDDVHIENNYASVSDSVSAESSMTYFRRCLIEGLQPLTDYVIQYTSSWDIDESHGGPFEEYFLVRTNDAGVSVSLESKTQTTVTVSLSPTTDEYSAPNSFMIGVNGDEFTEYEHKITSLRPDTTYKEVFYANYNGKWMGTVGSFSTASLKLGISAELSPTTIHSEASFVKGDADILKTWFDGYEESNKLVLTGLEPETEYTLRFNVELVNSDIISCEKKVTTPTLELALQEPQPMTPTDTKVTANTNISEMETNVGFQWRKYDAPESLKSSEGPAVVFENKIQGVIKRLQSTSYYNVRAYYKSAAGNYYFSDWITFDPSDFSYIDPIIYSYPDVTVADNQAIIRCYFIEGSDGIVNQGIEYWIKEQQNTRSATSSNINVVYATGLNPVVSLDNLNPGTLYGYRAFVTTKNGVVYGQESSFTTTGTYIETSIDSPKNDMFGGEVLYFDITGKKHSSPTKGVNIVIGGNGKIKKIINK